MSHSLTGCIQSSCFQVGGALKEGGTPNGLIWSNWMGVDRFQAGGGSMDVSKTEAEA
uniref:Uncharacterized protein n=1 Tax=Arundo donax TaxID=35708 RepID=A0A0A9C4Q3_ARUDO